MHVGVQLIPQGSHRCNSKKKIRLSDPGCRTNKKTFNLILASYISSTCRDAMIVPQSSKKLDCPTDKKQQKKKPLCIPSNTVLFRTFTESSIRAVRTESSLPFLFHKGGLSPCSAHHFLLFVNPTCKKKKKSNISERPVVFEGRRLLRV